MTEENRGQEFKFKKKIDEKIKEIKKISLKN